MIVTISNEYGSGAVAIAREEVEAAEDTRRSVGERVLARLELATPEMAFASSEESFDERCLREVQTAVREYATHGDVVLVGRAASAILGRRPDVLRVFLHAPRDWRIHHVMDGTGTDQKTAAAEVDR